MTKRTIAIMISIAMMLVAFTGCSNPDGKKLLEDAAKKQDIAKTVKMEMTFDLDLSMGTGGSAAGMSTNMKGEINMAFNAGISYVAMNLAMMGFTLNEECYIDSKADYLYVNSGGWKKAKLEEGENPLGSVFSSIVMESGDSEQMSSQSMASLFMLSKEITTKGKKDFNGISCYEIEISLNPEAFKSILTLAMAGTGGLGSFSSSDEALLNTMIDSIEVFAYVGASDGLMHGMEMQMGELFKAIIAEQAGSDADSVNFTKSDFGIKIISDFKDDAIKIPDEALNATEGDADSIISGSMLLQSFGAQTSGLGDSYDSDLDSLDDDTSLYTPSMDSFPSFDNMRMVKELTELTIGDEVESYKTTDEAFFVVANVTDITEPITVYIDWYRADNVEDQLIDSVSFDMDEDNIIHSTLSLETEAWPAGEYYVEFSASKQGDSKEDTIELASSVNIITFTVE